MTVLPLLSLPSDLGMLLIIGTIAFMMYVMGRLIREQANGNISVQQLLLGLLLIIFLPLVGAFGVFVFLRKK